jgi:hypothetical protein
LEFLGKHSSLFCPTIRGKVKNEISTWCKSCQMFLFVCDAEVK